jgi:hypothetical protein
VSGQLGDAADPVELEPDQALLLLAMARLVNLWPNNRFDELLSWAGIAARRQQQRAA